MSRVGFEIRHLIAAPFTLLMLVQFIVLFTLKRYVPKPVFYVLGFPFLIQDIVYNVVIGSFIFMERPKEWIFTDRIKRHVQDPDCPSHRFALVLNRFDEGHV
jgi:hypothetical protein